MSQDQTRDQAREAQDQMRDQTQGRDQDITVVHLMRHGEVANPDEHDLVVTRAHYESLPLPLREHLLCRVVDELEPITQRHDIEGLVMGAED